jgi:hypothetical protein
MMTPLSDFQGHPNFFVGPLSSHTSANQKNHTSTQDPHKKTKRAYYYEHKKHKKTGPNHKKTEVTREDP